MVVWRIGDRVEDYEGDKGEIIDIDISGVVFVRGDAAPNNEKLWCYSNPDRDLTRIEA